jgi:hypothetical protein
MDYSAIDALPNPAYGGAIGMPTGGLGNQDANVDFPVQRVTDVLQNQFGLKPNSQGHVYTPPFPEWYHRVALPNRVKVPTEFTKFSGQENNNTVEHFAESMGIKLLNSSPYYVEANGQAEASNKILIKIIQKKIVQKPKRWHSVLNEALWSYRMAPHGATQTSPYELVYRHHAILPWEMQSDSRRIVLQKDLSSKDYYDLMMDELEDLHMIRLRALENIEKNKMRVAKYYNQKVKVKQFAERDLVWKVLLPVGTKYSAFGKWSPNWEGPFRVVRYTPGNAYILKTLLGEEFTTAINGRYLKK